MQSNDLATKSYINMMHSRYYAPRHDPQFAEIEWIMNEVGIKFAQVTAYATEYLPDGVKPETAQCISGHDRFLINIVAHKFTIYIDADFDMYTLPSPCRMFDIYDHDFFLKLAQYLRKEKVLSLPKYWLVRLKLWWNK